MTGTVEQPPQCQVSVANVDFGTCLPGSPVQRQLTLTNVGGGELVGNIVSPGPEIIVSNGTYGLSAGQSQTVYLEFQGSEPGHFTWSLDLGSSCADLPLSGWVADVQIMTGPASACGPVEDLGHLVGAMGGFIQDWLGGAVGLHAEYLGGASLPVEVHVSGQEQPLWSGSIQGSIWTPADAGVPLSDFYDENIVLWLRVGDGISWWNQEGGVCAWELDFLDVAPALPSVFRLLAPVPNPFNPTTQLRVELPEPAWLRVIVHDLSGREVARLLDEPCAAGVKELEWAPRYTASGLYFVVAEMAGQRQVQRVMYVR